MSHYTVLVVGNDPESKLAPFHEFECTGTKDKYIQDINITEEARKKYEDSKEYQQSPSNDTTGFAEWAADYYGYKTVKTLDDLDKDHKYGYIHVENDKVRCIVKCTNPNAKWDWYVPGGLWSDYFLLKDGSRLPASKKNKIDFAGMRLEASVSAGESWDKIHAIVAGRAIPNWKTIRQSHDNIESARNAWHNHPVVKDLHELDVWIEIERFDCLRKEFCQRAIQEAVPTFAMIVEDKWYERGEMGWWGMVRHKKDAGTWAEEFNKLIDGLPDDTFLSVYDCHI